MSAAVRDLTLEQGATYAEAFAVSQGGVAVNLTGGTIAAQLRVGYDDATAVASCTPAITNAAGGLFTLTLSAAATAALSARAYVYDVTLTRADATVLRLVQGTVTVSPRVTR
jgi:hypothetical protein